MGNKKQCKYEFVGNDCIGYTTNKNTPFYVDFDDYDKICDYAWRLSKNGYIVAYSKDERKTIIYLHRLVMNLVDGDQICDHIDRCKENCRKSNLRICSQQQNVWNGSKRKGKNKIIGVYWRKNRQKWYVYIDINYSRIYLGQFSNLRSAIKERLKAEKEYFGEFAPQRHLFEQYGVE